MTVYQHLGHRQAVVILVTISALVLGVFAGMQLLPHLNPRWARLEVLAVIGAPLFVVVRLANSQLLRCPRCDADLSKRTTAILLKELHACPQCGASFADQK
ncbi:MAG TPA: hypothetical protein VK660_10790 [Xanthomonadaceae bacterium]|jgi:uncharacterized C2H2 Zn-finger protein|nr:hypothetical protein [Xanthomonadaceae bacterium]